MHLNGGLITEHESISPPLCTRVNAFHPRVLKADWHSPVLKARNRSEILH